ncbi:M28 family peptidase [Roseisolibacter sp. H3M3-2]|uniref:M28 family peptidase n=1 Tax=Roseisolibacter sp. H3M3-2 TaxID=3031323 RepID=UPI0023DABB8D|nr:M28 family peptidase [Roseisolibacter sp. H3M3-2]MDF1503632.1 M28 family peptidase [Roseisolibacter sp. H3M3-2]
MPTTLRPAARLAFAAALLASPLGAQPAAAPIDALHALVRAELSGERAFETVAYVAPRWRLPGNTGFDESIRHVEQRLRAAGYVRQDSAPAGARLTYRVERRPMARDTWEPVDAELSVVGRDAPLLRWATNRNMLAINSYPTPAGGVEAEVVDVGAARAEDFAGKDVAGKVVLADAPVGRLFAEAVQKRGAVGVLAYSLPAYLKPEVHVTSIQFGSVPQDTARRAWGLLLSHAARGALREAAARGPVRVRVRTDARSFRADELTLVADVRGDARPDERFVFSAHVQEPGANDNASGVGAQAEMARALAALVRAGRVSPRRSVTFLWGDEIKSTRDYIAGDSARALGIRWGMSLDMVGEDTEKTGGTFLIEKMPDPSAVWTRGDDRHTEWGGRPLKVEDVRPHYFNDYVLARARAQAARTGWVVRTNPFEGGSDHTPFLNAGKPGLLLWHFTDVFYHTDGDRLDKVSPRTLANVGATALAAALGLATADGAAARQVVAELERAAVARLATEEALSRAAVAARGDCAEELRLLRTWTRYYADALRAAADVEVGGSSAATTATIEAAVRRVEARGAAAARLP